MPEILLILLETESHSYCSAIYIFYSQLVAVNSSNSSLRNCMEFYFDAFIEEKNEMLLSFLARSVEGHPNKKAWNYLDRKFASLVIGRNIIDSFTSQNSKCESNVGTSVRVLVEKSKQSPETAAVISYILQVRTDLENGSWRCWKDKDKLHSSDPCDETTFIKPLYIERVNKFQQLAGKMKKKIELWKRHSPPKKAKKS